MKVTKFALIIAMGLTLPSAVLAEDEPGLMTQPVTVGDVTYISGGIGESEAEVMRGEAKSYPLEMVFILKHKELEEFLASVKVQIQDMHKKTILDVTTEGPYLFANLPPGKYLVTAENNGDVKHQTVKVQGKKHKKVVFWWPIPEEPGTEGSTE